VGFTGIYPSWERALAECDSYESSTIVEQYQHEILASRTEGGVPVEFDQREIRLVAALQAARALIGRAESGGLSILDFGGAAGRHYRLACRVPAFPISSYVIAESPAVAAALRPFGDETVSWVHFDEPSDLARRGAGDVFLASSSLQYVPVPFDWLRAAATSKVLVLDRLPLVGADAHFVAKQYARHDGKSVTYPAWFFSERRFFDDLDRIGLLCVMRWVVPEDSPVVGSQRQPNQGMVLLPRDRS
jgi:putative methyltransferase (TIGR04325 family)